MFGAEIISDNEQTKLDDNAMTGSGLDCWLNKPFCFIKFYNSMELEKQVSTKFGVHNVMDKTYAEHLNKHSVFDFTPIQVNELGRSVWTRVSIKFFIDFYIVFIRCFHSGFFIVCY